MKMLIKIRERLQGSERNGNGSKLCPMASFASRDVEHPGFVITTLV